jgi:hypothetical protein
MYYFIAIAMLLAGVITLLGYLGREPNNDRKPSEVKEP